jgi:uncharacterized membrane protein
MENPQSADQLAFERMLFFSDAVFAIAITLLVIEIRVPVLPHGASDRQLGSALVTLFPRFVGFIISFFLIGQTWVEHHRIGRQLRRYERGLLWSNLWMLFFVATMPFATALLSEYPWSRVTVTVYALIFTGLGLAKVSLWRNALRHRLVDVASAEAQSISRRVWATPLTAATVGGLGAVGVPFAMLGFTLIPLVARLLDRRGATPPKRLRTRPTAT